MQKSLFRITVAPHVHLGLILAVLGVLAFTNWQAQRASAATEILVTTTADSLNTDGFCSLREAVIAANKDIASSGSPGECPAGSGADTILLPEGIYMLSRSDKGKEDSSSTGDLDISGDLTILGSGRVIVAAADNFKDRIFHVLSGNVTVQNLTISGGKPSGVGGGIYNQGTLLLNVVTLSGNSSGSSGGAIANVGTLAITNSTLSDNLANADGGGLSTTNGLVELNNVTITDNTADGDSKAGGNGGGIFRSAGNLSLSNTIVAGNHDASAIQKYPDCSGILTSQGHNLVQSLAGCTLAGTGANDRTGVDPLLGALADNGGTTFTHALLDGSPAIDAGNPAAPGSSDGTCAPADQRGVARPQGPACDIGAFELEQAGDTPQVGPLFTVNTAEDGDDGVCGQAHCTLREAIDNANAVQNGIGPDEIHFAIPEETPVVISPSSALPEITEPLIIDGYTQSLSGVILDGSGAGVDASGLTISAGNSTITGLTIQSFSDHGILSLSGGGNSIHSNTITMNGGAGVRVISGTGNAILSNAIDVNGGLGIDLGVPGPEPNDAGDPDAGANGLQNFPVLLQAVPQNGALEVLGRLNSTPDSTFQLEFFTTPACDPDTYGEGKIFLASLTLTTDAAGNVTDSQGNPFFTTSLPAPSGSEQFVTATATSPSGGTSEFSQCIAIGENNTSWVQASLMNLVESIPQVESATVEQLIDKEGQSRWYRFSVRPGSKVIVTLSNLSANYDLTLYKDIAAAFEALNSTQDLVRLGAEFAPDVFSPDIFSPDVFSPDNFSPDVFSPDIFSPDIFSPDIFSPDIFSPDIFSPDVFSPDIFSPDNFSPDIFSPDIFSPDIFSPDIFSPDIFSPDVFSSAQSRSVIAASGFAGTASEGIVVNTWENTGDFYVRVRGRNGAFDLQNPFRLQVTLLSGTCDPVSPDLPPSSVVPAAGDYKTIILTDLGRMAGSSEEKSTLLDRLAAFAARPEVSGIVVDVGSDVRVSAANAQADSFPACPFAKNLVAASIKGIVDGYRELNPLEYVVIIGNDDAVPFFRHPDHALLANEKNYVPPVRDNTASQASLKLGYILSQDDYGAELNISIKEDSFPIPSLAVGRLVETPAEVIGMLDAYLTTSGGVAPAPVSALVTGYDFLEDAANAVGDELAAGLGSAGLLTELITPRGVSPADPAAWTADDLRARLLTERHDLVYLAAHFSAGSLLAADYSTRLLAREIAASPVDLVNALVFSAGCHAGYNIVNPHGIPGISAEPDWAQAFARKQATLIAGTGYQYGDTDFIEYSERLYLEFSRQLRTGSGPVSIGKALVAAKQQYLADTPQLRGIHEKALLEATLFGLPMLSVDLPGERLSSPAVPPVVSETIPFESDPGAFLGLSYADVTLQPALTRHDVVLNEVSSETTLLASYFSGPDGVVANPNEPVLPLDVRNISVPGTVLRGVGLRSATYTDLTDFLPLGGAATTEVRGAHAPFPSQVFFPVRFWNTNYFAALADPIAGDTRLATIPAQFKTDAPDALAGTLRRYDELTYRLYYSGNTASYGGGSVPALATSPSITRISAIPVGDEVHFFLKVVGDPAAGIQEVWVTYTGVTGPLHGAWQSLDLVQDASESTIWEGTLPLNGTDPADVRFMVQAANGVGLVTLLTNLGAYFTPGIETLPTTPTALEIEPFAASGAYGTQASFTAQLTTGGAPLGGMPVTIGLGSQSRTAVTGNDGRATVSIPLLGTPGLTAVQAAFHGSLDFAPSSASADFTITKLDTSLALTPVSAAAQYSDGPLFEATLKAGTGRRLGEKTVFFLASGTNGSHLSAEITDFAGRAALPSVTLPAGQYTVDVYYSGTIPLPEGSLILEDERYNPSSTSGSLEIIPEDAVLVYTGDTLAQSGAPIQLSAQVMQDPDGMPGDLTLAQLRYEVKDGLGDLVASILAPVTGDGVSTAILESGLPPGSYQVEATVLGGFFASSTVLTALTINAPPVCSLAAANPDLLWPPNSTFVMVSVIGVLDPEGNPVAIQIDSLFQDEPVGFGTSAPDGKGIGTSTAELRAERDQNADGRVYHIFFTAMDSQGGSCSGEVLVGIPSDQGGETVPIDGGALYDSTIPG